MAVILLILGALPFAAGYAMNRCMFQHPDALPPYGLISFLFLLAWGVMAFLLNRDKSKTRQTIVFLNLLAIVDLVLVGIQELILHAYWFNSIGVGTQLFFLPLINLGFRLTPRSHSVFPAYAASLLLMLGISWIGCKLKERGRP